MAAEQPDIDGHDAQDIAEVFDEDNLDSDSMRLKRDDEELNFDDMPQVYDATRADGDEDDDDAIIGDDLDDDEIVELSTQSEDEGEEEDDDDDYRAADSLEDDDEEASDEVELSYAGDLNTTAGAHSGAQRYESRTLSDDDLAELGYRPAPTEPKSFEAKPEVRDAASQAQADHEEDQLDSGLEETFPASDPVSVKHIT